MRLCEAAMLSGSDVTSAQAAAESRAFRILGRQASAGADQQSYSASTLALGRPGNRFEAIYQPHS